MSELIRREDAINAVEMFFEDAYIEDAEVHDLVYKINHIPAASPWHRVDEPPDTDEYVHAFDGSFVGMASFDGEKWWQHDTFESFIISPSYWMPRIPDPQKEKTMKGE